MKKITLLLALLISLHGFSQTTVNFDVANFTGGTGGIGFMNVFDHPQDGSVGGFVFGSGWGIADLVSVVGANTVELKPNRIGDPNPFWQTGNLEGAKLMEANHFFESNSTLGGDVLTFIGNVQSNTLDTSGFIFPIQSVAFIKVLDPNAGFATIASATTPLPATGSNFSVTLDVTTYTNGEIIQYGFQLFGPNVNIDPLFDQAYDDLGSIVIGPVNDDCDEAYVINPSQYGQNISGSNAIASNSNVADGCVGDNDVWYSFTTDADGGDVTVNVGAGFDYAIYSDCMGNLVGGCNSGITNAPPDTTYYLRIGDENLSRALPGGFTFSIAGSALSTDSFGVLDNLKVYPNPSNSVWNIESPNTVIEQVEVYDLLGKNVLTLSPNNRNVEIDASQLVNGLYLAKLTANGSTKTIRLVKN